MSELPSGWGRAEIGDLCNLINGRAFKPQEWSESGLPIIRIQNLNNPASKFNHFSGEFDAKHHVKNGDLLFAWSGTPGTSFGAHIWHGGDAVLNQHIFKIEFSERETSRGFLRYAINQKLDELISSAQGGVGLRHVTKGTFEKTEISFPPLAEQTRIAQKLDELLAQVDTLKARIDAIPALLKRFRQSVLTAAVSGRLTEGWRSSSVPNACTGYQSVDVLEPWSHTIEAPASWQKHIFEEVIKLVGGSQPPKSEFAYEQKPGFVRLIQIRDYKSDSHKVFINQESTKKFCDKHDVMIGRYGPPIFQILRGLEGAYNVALMKAVPLEELDNEYMYWYLQNYKLLNFVEAGSDRTAGQSGVNKAFLEKYPLFVPPLDEQTEIVRRVEQLFAFADQLEAKVASAKSRIDHLTQSILAKAFRGELVPQDPNEEPASVLLERIKAQRAAAPKAKRGRKASA